MNKYLRLCLIVAAFLCVSLVAPAPFFAIGSFQVVSPPQIAGESMKAKGPPPEGIDLDVTFINRAPLYKAYCVQYLYDVPNQVGRSRLCPGTENDKRWPDQGEIVTFTAHIINKGTLSSPSFGYVWHIDGVRVANGTLPALAPAAEATVTYQWPWAHALSPDGQRALGEHTVRFTVDPADAISETYETNNSLQDRTNAMSFSLYITPEMYEAYNVPVDSRFPYSAEDWLQKQIAAMNESFRNSIYPVTPHGVPLRVRINTIGIVPTNPARDGEHDGSWFIRDEVRCEECGWWDPATDVDWGLVHELGHQVSLIDLYALEIYAAGVFVQDRNGLPANFDFMWEGGGIMSGGDISPYTDPHLYSSHSAGGALTFAGYRNGYYGSYLYDIPLQNYLRILDSQGDPAPGVQVALYQRTGPVDWTGHMGLDGTPEISGTTDADGLFRLPNRSANGGSINLNGHILRDNPFGVVDIVGPQNLFLIRLAQDDHEEFQWLDITRFNLAYWMGDTISHTYTISSHLPQPGGPVAPALGSVRIEGAWASLEWEPSPSQGVAGYRVYRATWPQYKYKPVSGLLTETYFWEFGGDLKAGHHRLYAITAVGGDGLESGFSELAYAPGLGAPVSVVLAPDGARTVLNPWNMYPLLRQQADGRYTHRLLHVHYGLNLSHHLAYDGAGRLVISGFGPFPHGWLGVRLYDRDLQPLVGFGEEGTAPGQFTAPSGVAPWGPLCSFEDPLEIDDHTTLLLHFDGDYTGAQGEIGAANGTSFEPGRLGQGVLIDAADALTYTTEGNLDPAAGAIEFWVRPNWDGDDGEMHIFFETGPSNYGIQIGKDGVGYLHFLVWTPTGAEGVGRSLLDWRAQDWHHVAGTWEENGMALFIDGRRVDSGPSTKSLDTLGVDLHIGSAPGQGWQVDAVMDELRISDIPRLGNSDTCGRVLVADSELHRIQAFDSLGNVLTAYGSLGSGAGQFNAPCGMVVDKSGQVLVADQGNDRLVVLSFDGTEFDYLESIRAGFNAPEGVALDALGNIVVADTGNNRIVVLDPEGGFLAEYIQPNDGYTGPFNAPRGVAADPNGNLVVADTGNRRVVTVRGALPGGKKTWLPMVIRGGGAK